MKFNEIEQGPVTIVYYVRIVKGFSRVYRPGPGYAILGF
jgi:hypothetical protein